MLEKSTTEFIEQLSSKAPVPGGGGASALVGAVGIALGSMVGNLTLGKKKYAEVEEDIKSLQKKAADITECLKDLVKADAEAFGPLSDAYRMPSVTEEEKRQKDGAMQASLEAASRVPLEIAENCLEALELLEQYADKGSTLAVSDAGVGALFCKAALQGAGLNVLINTGIMKDKELKSRIENRLNKIETTGIAKAEIIYAKVRRKIEK